MAEYPLPKFHFQVDWGGSKLSFSEVTGMSIEQEMIEYRHGNSPDYSKLKMPGLRKYPNITLKRGTIKGDNEFFAWLNSVQLNTVQRRSLTISLLNETHEPVVVWKVNNAFPVKVMGSDLKADGNEVAIETIEIAHEGIVFQND